MISIDNFFEQYVRNNSFSSRYYNEIVKYNPKFYDSDGCYRHDEWTEFSDIGKVFDGHVFDLKEYMATEERFVKCVDELLSIVDVSPRIHYLEYYNRNNKRPLQSESLAMINKFKSHYKWGMRVKAEDVRDLIRLRLRYEIDFFLSDLAHNFVLDIGYDSYLHVYTELEPKQLNILARQNGLFCNPRSIVKFTSVTE